MFVGDIGSLGLGAAIAAGAILGGVEAWGLIAIAPAFYEAAATLWYGGIKKVNRRQACHSPVIAPDGKLSPPKGAERYTLAYFILGKRPMTEPRLVLTLLSLYALSGIVAVSLSLV
jgi:UDP-N-acetylmuramyl pentapeptide phosphotransferase/UDP-N-acetylglucosamine-1-phosphate transferase